MLGARLVGIRLDASSESQLPEVNAKLESVMRRAFAEVHESARKHRTHMRTGAYCLAVGRVADATLVRGLFP